MDTLPSVVILTLLFNLNNLLQYIILQQIPIRCYSNNHTKIDVHKSEKHFNIILSSEFISKALLINPRAREEYGGVCHATKILCSVTKWPTWVYWAPINHSNLLINTVLVALLCQVKIIKFPKFAYFFPVVG